jgi:hypothetical protein
MWFLFSRTSGCSHPRPARPARRASTRLILERLEDRTLPSFLAPVSYPVDAYPSAVAVGDFNGDGKLDLVTANYGHYGVSDVSVLLGNGDGTFQPARNFATGTLPVVPSVAVGDFNGDGKLDIVATNGSSVSVLLGNGDGTFQPAQTYGLPDEGGLVQTPLSLAVGDLNGDGKLDLVVTGTTQYLGYGSAPPGANYVNVLLGNGDGTFTDASTVQVPGGALPEAVALGDFKGDGKLDVVTAATNGVDVLLNNGNGTLAPPTAFATDGTPGSVAVGDFNGDGKLDLVTGNYTTGVGASISELLGNGDGTFQPSRKLASGDDLAEAADFNHDGKLDILTMPASNPNGIVSVLLGNGDGAFQSPLNYAAGPSPYAVAVGDFNGDGFPDLAVANNPGSGGASTVSVLLNAADWSAPQASSFAISGFPSPVTAGSAGNFTVTVKYADGSVDAHYTGTVHFTSSDLQAALPADYTFTAADAGVHTFSAALKTAGAQSITVTDTATASLSGSETGITVNSAAASTLSVAGFPSPITAGAAGAFTVTARDAYGNVATGYTGTVHFTSSDGKASLPANYTFTPADAGVHAFSATLRTAAAESISAVDTTTAGITGTEGGITVKPAAASRFILSGPTSITAGVTFSLTLTVEDAYGNVAAGYTGTVHFSSTDSKATLPKNYTFTASDQGAHTFTSPVLRTIGYQTITVTDTVDAALTTGERHVRANHAAAPGDRRPAGAGRCRRRVPLPSDRRFRGPAAPARGVAAGDDLPGQQAAGSAGGRGGTIHAGAHLRQADGPGRRRPPHGPGHAQSDLAASQRPGHRLACRAGRAARRLLRPALLPRHGGHRRA